MDALRGGLAGGNSRALIGTLGGAAPALTGGGGAPGSTLSSTGGPTSGGSTLRPTKLGGGVDGTRDRQGRSFDAIGTIELGSAAISTKFEEEDFEEDESHSVSDDCD